MSFIMKKEDGTLWDYTFKLGLRKISSSVKRMNVCLHNCALISESLLKYEGTVMSLLTIKGCSVTTFLYATPDGLQFPR